VIRRCVVAAMLIGFGTAGCGETSEPGERSHGVVNFSNWVDYIHPDTLPDFTRATGIDVNYDTFDADEALEAKLLAGNSGYDVVVPSYTYFQRQIEAGVFREIDRSKLHNYRELDAHLLSQLAVVDPGNRYGVPHGWGTTGLGVNVDRVRNLMPGAALDSWALVFDPDVVRKIQGCGVVMLDSPGDVVPSALNYLGRDPASRSPTDLQDAIATIARVQPFVRYFHSSQYVDDFANGEVCVALGWSGSLFQAIHASPVPNLRYVVPKEGASLWFDVMAIPRDAPNVDNAYRLIDYMLDPGVAADFTNATFYPSGVASAVAGVDEGIRNDEAIYPSPVVMQRLRVDGVESLAYERQRLRLWTAMKAGGTAH
jgi:putrescine transport system substrate-binding protein